MKKHLSASEILEYEEQINKISDRSSKLFKTLVNQKEKAWELVDNKGRPFTG
jgi:hypothetical protein